MKLKDGVKYEVMKSRENWLAKRKSFIGGSDAACLLGLNPWKTNVQLYREKVGLEQPEDISGNSVVKYGVAAEPICRELFRLDFPDLQLCYEEHNIWTNSNYPFAHASLDGWLIDPDGKLGIWENKTTTIITGQQMREWQEHIPDHYFCQVLWYMMVTGAEFAWLSCLIRRQGGTDIQIKRYYIDRARYEEDIMVLCEAGKAFTECVKEKREPALMLPEP